MRECPECRILVGGEGENCPLCGAELKGEPGEANWPEKRELRRRVTVFKWAFVIVMLMAFTQAVQMWRTGDIAGGILLLIWFLAGEGILALSLQKHARAADVVSFGSILVIVLLFATAFWYPGVVQAIPFIFMGILVLNCILTLTDKMGQSLILFIFSGAVFAASWIVAAILFDAAQRAWMFCLAVAIAAFVIMLIVNGRRIKLELTKKMSL